MKARMSLQTNLAAIAAAAVLASSGVTHAAPRDVYQAQFLASDGSLPTKTSDPLLKNAWGLAASLAGPWWVASNGSGSASIFDGDGSMTSPLVQIPGSPTGVVFNEGSGFQVSDGTTSAPAEFLIAGEDGRISGYNAGVPAPSGSTQAFVILDRSGSGAVYKGLALATTVNGDRLYATDFAHGRVDVFDASLAPVATPGAFVDPKLPEGFSPFGIRNVDGRIVVTYAKRDPLTNDDVKGTGLGAVNVFDTDGRLLAHLGGRGQLNAPWGIALAPPSFGRFGGDLLVGNFGDGTIVAFKMSSDMLSFQPDGLLRDTSGKPIAIDGLWGIAFGNDGAAGPAGTLYFAAGPNHETAGAFGRIDLAP